MTSSSRTFLISFGVGMPSRDFTSEDLFSSRMMSMHSSTHSSQMNTVGPAMSLRTSCWLLPQNEQYRVFLESLPPTLLIPFSVTLVRTNRGRRCFSSPAYTQRTMQASFAPELQHGGPVFRVAVTPAPPHHKRSMLTT